MTFVGGSFMKDELEEPEQRAEFLRLLFSPDLQNSTDLCSTMIKSFTQKLSVPAAATENASYLKQSCLPAGPEGVFLRNLSLTRSVHGTLVYGETLFQDCSKEIGVLAAKSATVAGITTSPRVVQVAEAYYEGVLKYVVH